MKFRRRLQLMKEIERRNRERIDAYRAQKRPVQLREEKPIGNTDKTEKRPE